MSQKQLRFGDDVEECASVEVTSFFVNALSGSAICKNALINGR